MSDQGKQGQGAKMFCKMCGGVIDRDSVFCYICGAKLRENPVAPESPAVPEELKMPKVAVQPIAQEELKIPVEPRIPAEPRIPIAPQSIPQGINNPKPPRKSKKGFVIGSICAAVLVLAVVIGMMTTRSSSGHWSDNILMVQDSGDPNEVFGSKIPKSSIRTVTFLDSWKGKPFFGAWDVSADGSGNVMAWVKKTKGGYDLYIAGKGGVAANANSKGLFSGYINVEQIQMNGNFHTDYTTDMSSMFSSCENLKSVDLSGLDTSNVTDMNNMFFVCENLKSIDLSGIDTSNVTDMNCMFFHCESLTSIDLSGFDTFNVTGMISMFHGCKSLTRVDVSGFDTSNVTEMVWMFYGCKSLTSVDISGFDAPNVTNVYGMFDDCESLTSLDLSNFTPDQIAEMEIPEGVTVYQ